MHIPVTVGNCRISKITEQTASFKLTSLFPDHLCDMADDEDKYIELSVHSWVIKTASDIIIIDTATGNHRNRNNVPLFHQLNTNYLQNLKQAGFSPEDVTYVLLTHLHTDHVGWNTGGRDGKWKPFFPNARYICSETELEHCKKDEKRRELYQDSILPLIENGKLETIDIQASPLFAGILKFMPTPGHSIDHASITLQSAGEYALFTGDIMHNPVQFAYPHWNSVFCENKPLAEQSRIKAIDWCKEHHALWFSSHFPGASYGRVLEITHGQKSSAIYEEK
ncbi:MULTISPECIES: MBL fold metallo-hydrolase [Rahnella]|uniref:MBL fold metallo-hydrolase n=1 Tax=Rahnella TaxID=34037 RepID=UPI001E345B83|nr:MULTISPECIES: MBL fold metallo-hydrolase [Rahnella]